MRFIVRIVINAVAIWAAAQLVSGIELTGSVTGILIVALIFGIINAIIRPVLKILSFPFILVTLGLFILVINAALLWLTAALSDNLSVEGFVPALLGSIVISIVSFLLNAFLGDEERERKGRR